VNPVVFLTFQSGSRASDLRTVVLAGEPRVNQATGVLTAELAEGRWSALPWWNVKVHGREADDRSFEIPVEMVRKIQAALQIILTYRVTR
jgi:hypothetical protein